MKAFKLLLFFLAISLFPCAQNSPKQKVNPEAVRLVKKVYSLFPYSDNGDSCKKALLFLDSATTIDSNFFMAYYNKLTFLGGFNNKLFFPGDAKQTDKALDALNEMTRIQPTVNYWFTLRGNIYEKKNDTISSKKDYLKSLSICNKVLDTMNKKNPNYTLVVTNKAINLILLNDSAEANKILKAVYKDYPDNSEWDQIEKEYILSLMNKNKKQLMQPLTEKDSETDIYLNQ